MFGEVDQFVEGYLSLKEIGDHKLFEKVEVDFGIKSAEQDVYHEKQDYGLGVVPEFLE